MDVKSLVRQRRKRQLVQELAKLHVEETVEAGDFNQTPHFGVIERTASEFGKQLSRETLERASREAVTGGQKQANSCAGDPFHPHQKSTSPGPTHFSAGREDVKWR